MSKKSQSSLLVTSLNLIILKKSMEELCSFGTTNPCVKILKSLKNHKSSFQRRVNELNIFCSANIPFEIPTYCSNYCHYL